MDKSDTDNLDKAAHTFFSSGTSKAIAGAMHWGIVAVIVKRKYDTKV